MTDPYCIPNTKRPLSGRGLGPDSRDRILHSKYELLTCQLILHQR